MTRRVYLKVSSHHQDLALQGVSLDVKLSFVSFKTEVRVQLGMQDIFLLAECDCVFTFVTFTC